MMQWLRWYRGTHADPKFGAIARKHGVHKCAVVSVWAGVLEYAGGNGGSLDGLDHSDLAAALDLDDSEVRAIMSGFADKKMIADSAVVQWKNRQFQSDNVTARVKKSRAAKRPGNVSETLHDGSGNVAETAPVENETPPDTDTDTEREDSEATASDADAPFEGEDLKSRIFGPALAWLAEHTGKTERSLRSMLGKWCRDHGDGAVLEALQAAARAGPIEPVAWIEAKLAGTAKQTYGQPFKTSELLERMAENEPGGFGEEGDPDGDGDAVPLAIPGPERGTGGGVPNGHHRDSGAVQSDGARADEHVGDVQTEMDKDDLADAGRAVPGAFR